MGTNLRECSRQGAISSLVLGHDKVGSFEMTDVQTKDVADGVHRFVFAYTTKQPYHIWESRDQWTIGALRTYPIWIWVSWVAWALPLRQLEWNYEYWINVNVNEQFKFFGMAHYNCPESWFSGIIVSKTFAPLPPYIPPPANVPYQLIKCKGRPFNTTEIIMNYNYD